MLSLSLQAIGEKMRSSLLNVSVYSSWFVSVLFQINDFSHSVRIYNISLMQLTFVSDSGEDKDNKAAGEDESKSLNCWM